MNFVLASQNVNARS